MTVAKQFVWDYWFDHHKNKPSVLSKSVTKVLEWFQDGKITPKGKQAYRVLVNNLNK